jgi:hypothetical protein
MLVLNLRRRLLVSWLRRLVLSWWWGLMLSWWWWLVLLLDLLLLLSSWGLNSRLLVEIYLSQLIFQLLDLRIGIICSG